MRGLEGIPQDMKTVVATKFISYIHRHRSYLYPKSPYPMLWEQNIASWIAVVLTLSLVLTCGTDSVANEDDAKAVYGEIASLVVDINPSVKTGHDALSPLTEAVQGYYLFKERLDIAYGLSYSIEFSPQFQWDARFNGTYHSNSETNFIVQWAPIDHLDAKKGSLIGWYQLSHTLGSLDTSSFMDETGVITPLNGGDTAPDNSRDLLQMLVWEQWFLRDQLRFGIGKLTTRTFLNLNRYATSDREDFFTPMLVNNPVVPLQPEMD